MRSFPAPHQPHNLPSLAADVVGLWRCNEAAAGNDFTDASANARTLTQVGSPGVASPVFPASGTTGSRTFNGTTQWARRAHDANEELKFQDEFTFEAWVRPATVSVEQCIFSMSEYEAVKTSAGNEQCYVGINSSGGFTFGSESGSGTAVSVSTASAVFQTEVDHHVAVVKRWSRSQPTKYDVELSVNGILVASGTIVNSTGGSTARLTLGASFRFGASTVAPGRAFTGRVDDVIITRLAKPQYTIREDFMRGARDFKFQYSTGNNESSLVAKVPTTNVKTRVRIESDFNGITREFHYTDFALGLDAAPLSSSEYDAVNPNGWGLLRGVSIKDDIEDQCASAVIRLAKSVHMNNISPFSFDTSNQWNPYNVNLVPAVYPNRRLIVEIAQMGHNVDNTVDIYSQADAVVTPDFGFLAASYPGASGGLTTGAVIPQDWGTQVWTSTNNTGGSITAGGGSDHFAFTGGGTAFVNQYLEATETFLGKTMALRLWINNVNVVETIASFAGYGLVQAYTAVPEVHNPTGVHFPQANGAWYTLVFVFDGAGTTSYIIDTAYTTTGTAMPAGAQVIRIGSAAGTAAPEMKLGGVYGWNNTTITAAEIKAFIESRSVTSLLRDPAPRTWLPVFEGIIVSASVSDDEETLTCLDGASALQDVWVEPDELDGGERVFGTVGGSPVETELQAIIEANNPAKFTLTQPTGADALTTNGSNKIVVTLGSVGDPAGRGRIHSFKAGDVFSIEGSTNFNGIWTVDSVTDWTVTSVETPGPFAAENTGTLRSNKGYLGLSPKAPQLWVPTSPAWNVYQWNVSLSKNVAQELEDVMAQIGWRVAFRWDDEIGMFRLKLYNPSTSPTTVNVYPSDILSVSRQSVKKDDVRNIVTVEYARTGTTDNVGQDLRYIQIATDVPSVDKFGRRYCRIGVASTSLITTASEALELANRVLDDLKAPQAETEIVFPLRLDLEVGDLIHVLSEDDLTNYDAEPAFFNDGSYGFSSFGCVGVSHEISDKTARTTLRLRSSTQPSRIKKHFDYIQAAGAVQGKGIKPPARPAAPTVQTLKLGGGTSIYGLRVSWPHPVNNLNGAWDTMEVHVGPAGAHADFTPSSSTLQAVIRGSNALFFGLASATDYSVVIIARDRMRNASQASARTDTTTPA